MTPSEFRSGAAERRDQVRNQPKLARTAYSLRRATRACAPSCSATTPTVLRATSGSGFRMRGSSPAIPPSSSSPRQSSPSSKIQRSGLDLPLDIRGTAFQHRVWNVLRRIPVGSTASYADIAKAIGAPKSSARGGACLRVEQDRGGNTLPPRHRVGWVADRLSWRHRAQARAARQGDEATSG